MEPRAVLLTNHCVGVRLAQDAVSCNSDIIADRLASPYRCLQQSCEQALLLVAGSGGDQKTASGGIPLVHSNNIQTQQCG